MSTTFMLMLSSAALACLLPPSWSGCARAVTFPLTWLQSAVGMGSRAVRRAVDLPSREQLSPADVRALEARNGQLQRQLQHQSVMIDDLKTQIEQLSGLRNVIGDDQTRLISASVIAYDPFSSHESLTITVGSLNTTESGRIRIGQWVAAGVEVGQEATAESGRILLARQWLLGRISEVGPFFSRVQLASDSRFGPIHVRVAKRLPDGVLVQAINPETGKPRFSLLEGVGGGRMAIRQAPLNYFEAEFDRVLVPRSANLPNAMLIGRVVSAEAVENAPLMFDLTIDPLFDLAEIGRVFVIVTSP